MLKIGLALTLGGFVTLSAPCFSQTPAQYAQAGAAGRRETAKTIAAQQDVKVLEQALKLYRRDAGWYPNTKQGLQALTARPLGVDWHGPYLERLPRDPWGNPYRYRSPGLHGAYDVYSTGGAAGASEDVPTVIGNWD
ncbi:type II secretion system major pseudopilin GspG [Robbsia andropogonis]|uniref:type II secretion system major pseudopilin GspG n=1 Tax=Robbsia andropogonis TaxID=28092 RepID=UPI00209EC442|nr:type II secretion system major pseudopilin GspG [Robbsia andropogonis]MCP1117021.1 type II secretion system major pseudopilin GspG [Robbsia andropogonis]MCP1126300.1 type II secretion system major pseudopilin GspG [Robbsia andropogonis]